VRGIGALRENLVVPRRAAVLADALSVVLFDMQTALAPALPATPQLAARGAS
jgi:hypothetical protein